MFCSLQAWSQGPLSVGDRLPDIEWTIVKNYDRPSLNTNAFNDRLLILDFWSTFCTACIQGFPKMQALQKKFGNKLQVVLVNAGDDEARIEKYVGMKFLQRFQLPTVFHDSIAKDYFPHRTIPHYVWIYKGQVKAITEGDEVNEKNIQDLFNGKKLSMQQKIMVDKERLLFTSELLPVENTIHYSLLIKGHISGVGGRMERKEKGEVSGYLFINYPLYNIYEFIGHKKIKGFSPQRIVFEITDRKQLVEPDKEHQYSFEFRVAPGQRSRINDIMLDELNRLTNYSVSIEKRTTPCLVLLFDSSLINANFKPADNYYKWKSSAEMTSIINQRGFFQIPVIDGTGFRFADARFPETGINGDELIRILKVQGYRLREENREMEMMVIREGRE
jgi:thiol-disulfide isomerase/thioredoxin